MRYYQRYKYLIQFCLLTFLIVMFRCSSFASRGCQSSRSQVYSSTQSRYLTGVSHIYLNDVDETRRKVTYMDTGAHDSSHLSSKCSIPLVFIMGTAQTIPAYSANIQALSRKHRVIIIELRGQGSTELSSSYATTKQQIADIHNILPKIIGHQTPIHLAGYSFGGRIALAYAAHYPSFVSRLSITGVPLQRSATGRIIIRSWLEALQRNNLRDCAWSLVLNGYSDEMLSKMEKKIGSAVDYIVEANDPVRLYDLIRLSHEMDPQSAFAVHNCALQIKCPTQVIAGRYDRIAGFDETVKLSQTIPRAQLVSFDAGHSIPFEKTSQWCRTLSDFLLQ